MSDNNINLDSNTAGVNAVSMATVYVDYVVDPSQIVTLGGDELSEEYKGLMVKKFSHADYKEYIDPEHTSSSGGFYAKDGILYGALYDVRANEPYMGSNGNPVAIEYKKIVETMVDGEVKEVKVKSEGIGSDVSWRTDGGVVLQYPQAEDPSKFLEVLQGAFPEVNTIRLDFNAFTIENVQALARWKSFAQEAADLGYQLVIQYSDGDLAGSGDPIAFDGTIGGNGERIDIDFDLLGPADALTSDDGSYWKIEDVRDDWKAMIDWFNDPDNIDILESVYGWELINEPMAYGNSAAAGEVYSQHIHDLITETGIDWGDKKLLVGGLRASAQFEHINLETIRDAAGDQLVWSVHMYPGWVTPKYLDSNLEYFLEQVEKRIGVLEGDDLLVTETQLSPGDASLDYVADSAEDDTSNDSGIFSYNMARALEWLSQNGVGYTWWPPVARKSSLLKKGGDGWSYEEVSAAFAHNAYGYNESAEDVTHAEHFGSDESDSVAVGLSSDHMTEGLVRNYGLFFGLDGDDVIIGHDGRDMLYGGAGDDSIDGLSGNDYIFGNQGDDTLVGGDGDDVIIDHEGFNLIRGGRGNDRLEGSGKLSGGDGNDTLILISDAMTTQAWGGDGADIFVPDVFSSLFVKDFQRGVDRLDLSFWVDEKSISSVVIAEHLNGKGQPTGDIKLINSYGDHGNSVVRVRGPELDHDNLQSLDPSSFVNYGDLTFHYELPVTPDSGGEIHGTAGNDYISISTSSSAVYGGGGSDIFSIDYDGEASTTIMDFSSDDLIDLGYWADQGTVSQIKISPNRNEPGQASDIIDLVSDAGNVIKIRGEEINFDDVRWLDSSVIKGVGEIELRYEVYAEPVSGAFYGSGMNEDLIITQPVSKLYSGGGEDLLKVGYIESGTTRVFDFDTRHDAIDFAFWEDHGVTSADVFERHTGQGLSTNELMIVANTGAVLRLRGIADDFFADEQAFIQNNFMNTGTIDFDYL